MQGDILFLHMSKEPIRVGEIVVFNVDVSMFTFLTLVWQSSYLLFPSLNA